MYRDARGRRFGSLARLIAPQNTRRKRALVSYDRAVDAPSGATSDRRPVLIVTPWYGGDVGGVAVSSASLAASLERIGVPVVVLYLAANRLPRFRRGDGGELTIGLSLTPRTSRDGNSLRSFVGYWVRRASLAWTIRRLANLYRLRLVHFQYCIDSYDDILTEVQRYGVPVISTFRGSEVNVHFDAPEMSAVIRRLIKVSARITTVSEGLGRALARKSPEAAAKAEVIRNAVPLSVWDAEANASRPAADGLQVDVLFAGNLLPVKGPDLLLEAFRIVHAHRPDATLAFVGSGTMEDELREMVAGAGLGKVVAFRGRVVREQVLQHFHQARILALPSRNEGMPLAAMEAHMVGVPVVAMDVGGVSEVVRHGETGLVVPAGDAAAFADALLGLLGDEPRRARFGRAARERALTRFNPLEMAKRYAALYDRVAPVASQPDDVRPLRRSGT